MQEREEAGQYPFTRGLHPGGYRGKLWTMRQYAGFGTAAESNRRYRYLLERGTTGLSVAFDLPTQIGYDSDDPQAAGEVGRVGVAIDSLEDMEVLLEGIPLERVSTSMTINATAAILLALYVAVARRRGIAEDALSGTVQNDILKDMARGISPRSVLRLVTPTSSLCAQHVPRWNPISISGYHPRGRTAARSQFTLAHALGPCVPPRGRLVRTVRRRLSFFFACTPISWRWRSSTPPPLGPPLEGTRRRERRHSTCVSRQTGASPCRPAARQRHARRPRALAVGGAEPAH